MYKRQAIQLIDLPEGTSLFNVDPDQITEDLKQNPWVSGVDVQRQFPHTLIITPMERKVIAIAYISSADLAWACLLYTSTRWLNLAGIQFQPSEFLKPFAIAYSAIMLDRFCSPVGNINEFLRKMGIYPVAYTHLRYLGTGPRSPLRAKKHAAAI